MHACYGLLSLLGFCLFNPSRLFLQCGSYRLLIESLVGVCFPDPVKTAFESFESSSLVSCLQQVCYQADAVSENQLHVFRMSLSVEVLHVLKVMTLSDFTVASSLLHHLRTPQMFPGEN